MKAFLREIYQGKTSRALAIQWWMLAFDILVVLYFIITTFMERSSWMTVTDYIIGVFLLIDYLNRLYISKDRLLFLSSPFTIIDTTILISLFSPLFIENLIFLRILRTFRLLRSYHVLRELRMRSQFFARRQEIIFASFSLFIFIFIVSALVYALQSQVNPAINNYIDALYFTITTLTTTGFGDITLVGSTGRLLAVVIMIVGVSLFLRLVQTIFRPNKVQYECPDCGLNRHDPDAVHCKHCGRTLHIRTDGE